VTHEPSRPQETRVFRFTLPKPKRNLVEEKEILSKTKFTTEQKRKKRKKIQEERTATAETEREECRRLKTDKKKKEKLRSSFSFGPEKEKEGGGGGGGGWGGGGGGGGWVGRKKQKKVAPHFFQEERARGGFSVCVKWQQTGGPVKAKKKRPQAALPKQKRGEEAYRTEEGAGGHRMGKKEGEGAGWPPTDRPREKTLPPTDGKWGVPSSSRRMKGNPPIPSSKGRRRKEVLNLHAQKKTVLYLLPGQKRRKPCSFLSKKDCPSSFRKEEGKKREREDDLHGRIPQDGQIFQTEKKKRRLTWRKRRGGPWCTCFPTRGGGGKEKRRGRGNTARPPKGGKGGVFRRGPCRRTMCFVEERKKRCPTPDLGKAEAKRWLFYYLMPAKKRGKREALLSRGVYLRWRKNNET